LTAKNVLETSAKPGLAVCVRDDPAKQLFLTALRMKEFCRVALVIGLLMASSIARAGAPDQLPPERSVRWSPLPTELLGFKFTELSLRSPSLASTGPSSLPNDDSGEAVKMPKFVVLAPRIVIQEKELLTDYGRVELAKKQFTTPLYRATFGPLAQVATYYFNFLTILNGWHPSDAEAMTLYRESERVRILSDFDDLCRLEGLGDPNAGEELRRMRSGVWRTGFDSLYGDPFVGSSGIHIGRRRR